MTKEIKIQDSNLDSSIYLDPMTFNYINAHTYIIVFRHLLYDINAYIL